MIEASRIKRIAQNRGAIFLGVDRPGTTIKTETYKTGIDKTGIDKTGIDETGIDKTGIDKTGINITGIDKILINQTRISDFVTLILHGGYRLWRYGSLSLDFRLRRYGLS